jgi:hypothetical protein
MENSEGRPTNVSELRNKFRSAIATLVEATASAQQASACVDAIVQHVATFGISVNTDAAQRDFQKALENGNMVETCTEWWDELVSGIRYPVACCHIVTGTLPGEYVRNTVAAIIVYDQNGKAIGHDIVEWADCAQDETDKECYAKFTGMIWETATRLGARSVFEFNGEGTVTRSVSIAHDSDGGATYFHHRQFRTKPDNS